MSESENESIVRKMFRELNRHDLDAWLEHFADDATLTVYSGRRFNKKEAHNLWSEGFKIFPDLKYNLIRLVSQGDTVVIESTATGTHMGEYYGIAATNKKFTLPRLSIYDLKDGKVKQVRMYANERTLIQQLTGE